MAAPALHDFVIPITLLVLTVLFAVQRLGTGIALPSTGKRHQGLCHAIAPVQRRR